MLTEKESYRRRAFIQTTRPHQAAAIADVRRDFPDGLCRDIQLLFLAEVLRGCTPQQLRRVRIG